VLSSADDDDDDDVDQLLLVSSPNTELSSANLIKEIEDSKLGMFKVSVSLRLYSNPSYRFLCFALEEIRMPRARRIGGLADMDKRASFEVGKVLDKGCVTSTVTVMYHD
jgi:hypothetical protein